MSLAVLRQRHPDAASDLWCGARQPARVGAGSHEGLGHILSGRAHAGSRDTTDSQPSAAVRGTVLLYRSASSVALGGWYLEFISSHLSVVELY